MKCFAIVFTLMIAVNSQAGVLFDLNGTYISDSTTTSSSASDSRVGYGLGVLFNIDKAIWGGWSYSGFNHSDTVGSTTTALSAQDTGPTFKWQFGRGKLYQFGLTYNIVSRASYSSGTTNQDWEGSSYLVYFGAMPEISNGWRVGFSLNYYSASYTKKKISNVESAASFSKTWLYPTVGISKEF